MKRTIEQIEAIIDPSLPLISNLSNLIALLYHEEKDLNWVGFYLIDQKKQMCYLGPFQGKVACTTIPIGKGVVGTCALEKHSIYINNVHTFIGHIACDSNSRSEFVAPIFNKKELWGLLDIDSPKLDRFNQEECLDLEKIASIVSKLVSNS